MYLCPSYSALMESLITPLQDKIEDWKKTANQLDKDHAKGTQVTMLIHQMVALLSSYVWVASHNISSTVLKMQGTTVV